MKFMMLGLDTDTHEAEHVWINFDHVASFYAHPDREGITLIYLSGHIDPAYIVKIEAKELMQYLG